MVETRYARAVVVEAMNEDRMDSMTDEELGGVIREGLATIALLDAMPAEEAALRICLAIRKSLDETRDLEQTAMLINLLSRYDREAARSIATLLVDKIKAEIARRAARN